MVVHGVLAERAGLSIDWAATEKVAYLAALTNELDNPDKGHLSPRHWISVVAGEQG
jgi:cell filamentation protein